VASVTGKRQPWTFDSDVSNSGGAVSSSSPPSPRSPSRRDWPVVPGNGSNIAPGGALSSAADCAARRQAAPETRPHNTAANHSVPPADYRVPDWPREGYAPEFNAQIIPRIDGRFTGTTDEIIAWAACHWGLDPDIARAVAVEESDWNQSHTGDISGDPADCVGGATPPCPTSFGLMQLKHSFRPGSWPYSVQDTAFNVDYALGAIRGCYEGWVTYLQNGYTAGNLWDCLGWHYAGDWKSPAGNGYVNRVHKAFAARAWDR
jgi:autotransporter family porin